MMRGTTVIAGMLLAGSAQAQEIGNAGPYNARFLQGGVGIERPLEHAEALVAAGAPYTIATWVDAGAANDASGTLIRLGIPGSARALSLEMGRMVLRDGTTVLRGGMVPKGWHHLAAVSDGARVTLYLDGRRVGGGAARSSAVAPQIAIAPTEAGQPHFGGQLIDARVSGVALDARQVAAIARAKPDAALVQMTEVGVGWPFQKQANIGLTTQQDAWTLPQSRDGAYTAPVAKPLANVAAMQPVADNRWQVNGWTLAAAPEVKGDGAMLSRPGAPSGTWRAATVPGTVLQTLVDRGVYPDPYYGLNNLKILESRARQD